MTCAFLDVDKEDNYKFSKGTEREKRDIRNDIFESELQIASKTYNSEIMSQSKSALNSIISQANGLNGQRNLLNFSFNNLATNGLNDVHIHILLKGTVILLISFSAQQHS